MGTGARTLSLFTPRQAEELLQLLRAAARAEIMPRFRKLDRAAIRAKGSALDLVTDADEAAEAMIAQGLRRLHPGCLVVGEEASAHDASLIAGLAGADLAFVVDPIDGTSNYAAGLPLFGVMAAGIIRGEVGCSVIYDPVSDSASLAVRGEGAWEQAADGSRSDLRVAAAVPIEQMTGVISWRYLPRDIRARIMPNLTLPAQIWDFRCSAHQYRMLVAGHCHFLMYNRLMPWDHLPGWLLHREAGGFARKFDGSEHRPGETSGGLICAPDEASWNALRTGLWS
jgi:fructose-1,6-bisphosphatase/inositol monophosphatase family enzyme